jgi:hypothetical protein
MYRTEPLRRVVLLYLFLTLASVVPAGFLAHSSFIERRRSVALGARITLPIRKNGLRLV